MKPRHYYSLDILRGLVALLVCLYHLTEGFLPDDNPFRFIFSRGYLGVEIFFVISGFVIPYTMYLRAYQYDQAGNFLLKRLIRIEPPYWMSIALIYLVDYISTFFRHYEDKSLEFDLYNIFLHVFHLNDIVGKAWLKGIYWSLAVEVQYYLLIALIFPFLVAKKQWVRYLCLFLFCMGRWLDFDHSVFYYGCHFVSGILFFQFTQQIISKKEFIYSMLICWGLTLWCFDIYHLSAVIGATLVIVSMNVNFAPLVWMGKISYSFYLIHIQVAWVLMDAMRRSYPEENIYYQMCTSVAAAIVASSIFYYIIERPCHLLAKRI